MSVHPPLDLVVVGAGNAGLAAAVTAGEEGLRTLVLEKGEEVGGQLHWSSGHFSAAGTRRQRQRGILDDPAWHAAEVEEIGEGRGTSELIRLATRVAGPAVDWLEDLGLALPDEVPALVPGHELYRVPRTYWAGDDPRRGGLPLLEVLTAALTRQPSVEVRRAAPVTELMVDGRRCRGVVCADGERIEAKAVLLATGGYAAARDLVAELQPEHGEALTGCLPHATGDGLRMLRRLGVPVVAADTYLPTMGTIPDPDRPGHALPVHQARLVVNAAQRRPWELWVDRHGERFVDEGTSSPAERERALRDRAGLWMAAVWDQDAFETAPPAIGPDWTRGDMAAEAERGRWLHRASSLADLAVRLGVEPEGLAETVAAWNRGDDPFDRSEPRPQVRRPPYWGVVSVGGMLLSRGGPAVDVQLRPLIDGEHPIGGLHCSGELLGMGQLSGAGFAGGMSVGPALALSRWVVREVIAPMLSGDAPATEA